MLFEHSIIEFNLDFVDGGDVGVKYACGLNIGGSESTFGEVVFAAFDYSHFVGFYDTHINEDGDGGVCESCAVHMAVHFPE